MIGDPKLEKAIRHLLVKHVCFGSMGIRLYEPEQLHGAQVGYSVHPDGSSLIGGEEGDWKAGWVVIGYEDLCGDPIFVDVLSEDYPVYTAMHGEGSWDARLIANSIAGLGAALAVVAALAKGRGNPVELDANPLPVTERETAIERIQESNPGIGVEFWELWLTQ